MNRRNFIGSAMTALAGFTILPSAGRIWKAVREPQINPAWVNAQYGMKIFTPSSGWNWIDESNVYQFEGARLYKAEYEMYWEGKRL